MEFHSNHIPVSLSPYKIQNTFNFLSQCPNHHTTSAFKAKSQILSENYKASVKSKS